MTVVNGCKLAHAREVTVVHGIIQRTSEGATPVPRKREEKEEKAEEEDHPLEGVLLALRAQPGAPRVDPLVEVGLGTQMAQRGKAEVEATLAERPQDPPQEVARRAPQTHVLFARITYEVSAKGSRINAPSGILLHAGSSKRETAKRAETANICILRLRTSRRSKAPESLAEAAARVRKRTRKKRMQSPRKTRRNQQDWPLCCQP